MKTGKCYDGAKKSGWGGGKYIGSSVIMTLVLVSMVPAEADETSEDFQSAEQAIALADPQAALDAEQAAEADVPSNSAVIQDDADAVFSAGTDAEVRFAPRGVEGDSFEESPTSAGLMIASLEGQDASIAAVERMDGSAQFFTVIEGPLQVMSSNMKSIFPRTRPLA